MSGVNAKFLKILDGGRTKQVAPNSCHHEHICATKTGRDRLIRAFASESEIESLPENRFPRLRKLIRESCQIDVGTSNHRDARSPNHSFFRKDLRPPSVFTVPARVNGDGTRLLALENSRFLECCWVAVLVARIKEEYSYTLSCPHLPLGRTDVHAFKFEHCAADDDHERRLLGFVGQHL